MSEESPPVRTKKPLNQTLTFKRAEVKQIEGDMRGVHDAIVYEQNQIEKKCRALKSREVDLAEVCMADQLELQKKYVPRIKDLQGTLLELTAGRAVRLKAEQKDMDPDAVRSELDFLGRQSERVMKTFNLGLDAMQKLTRSPLDDSKTVIVGKQTNTQVNVSPDAFGEMLRETAE